MQANTSCGILHRKQRDDGRHRVDFSGVRRARRASFFVARHQANRVDTGARTGELDYLFAKPRKNALRRCAVPSRFFEYAKGERRIVTDQHSAASRSAKGKGIAMPIQHLPCDSPSKKICEVLERDGCVVLDALLDRADIDQVTREMAPHLEAAPKGTNDFDGFETRRAGTLVARSPKAREIIIDGGRDPIIAVRPEFERPIFEFAEEVPCKLS